MSQALLPSKFKVLNIVQTIGFAVLKIPAAIISFFHTIIVAIPNYIENHMNFNKDYQLEVEEDIFYNQIGGNKHIDHKHVGDNPKPINFLKRIVFGIVSPILFAITAPLAELRAMIDNIVSCFKEGGINILKSIPLLITGLIKCAAAPLRGFADGLTNSYMNTEVNRSKYSIFEFTYKKPINYVEDDDYSATLKVACGIASPVVDGIAKPIFHLVEIKEFYESNADFLMKINNASKKVQDNQIGH